MLTGVLLKHNTVPSSSLGPFIIACSTRQTQNGHTMLQIMYRPCAAAVANGSYSAQRIEQESAVDHTRS